MTVVDIVPEKGSAESAQFETLFGVVLDVFVGVRPIDKKESRTASLAVIPRRGIAEMLADSLCAWFSGKFTPDRSSLDEMMVVLWYPHAVRFFVEIRRKIQSVDDGFGAILGYGSSSVSHVCADFEDRCRSLTDKQINENDQVFHGQAAILVFADAQQQILWLAHDPVRPHGRNRSQEQRWALRDGQVGNAACIFQLAQAAFFYRMSERGPAQSAQGSDVFVHCMGKGFLSALHVVGSRLPRGNHGSGLGVKAAFVCFEVIGAPVVTWERHFLLNPGHKENRGPDRALCISV